MDSFWIINFNEQMEFQVWKCGRYSHDNIYDKSVDESAFVSMKWGFWKS
jgi:hypothetical protein